MSAIPGELSFVELERRVLAPVVLYGASLVFACKMAGVAPVVDTFLVDDVATCPSLPGSLSFSAVVDSPLGMRWGIQVQTCGAACAAVMLGVVACLVDAASIEASSGMPV